MVSLDKAGPKNQKRVILGVIIIALGVLALFANFLSGLHLLQFWPVMFIVFGCMKVSQSEGGKGSVFGVILIALGGLMTLSNLGMFHLSDMWPLFLIGAGVLILTKSERDIWAGLNHVNAHADATSENYINLCSIFGSSETKVVSQAFQGGEATAIFGAVSVDFSAASIPSRTVIRVFSLFGGVELKVPADWSVVNNTFAVAGGVDDKSAVPKESGKCLIIEGFVVFGGIEIKN